MKKNSKFTLIELLVAMAVLAIFLLALMQFFTSTQNLVTVSTARLDSNENARVAMNLIATDIQSVFYDQGTKKIYFAPYDSTKLSDNASSASIQNLRFAATRPEPLSGATSKVTFVCYEYDVENMTLSMYAFGDNKNECKRILDTTTWNPFDSTNAPQNLRNDNRVTILENVTDFNVTCYYWFNGKLDVMDNAAEFYTAKDANISGGQLVPSRIPDAVKVSFTTIDRESMDKLALLCGTEIGGDGKITRPVRSKINTLSADVKEENFDNKKRTFSRTMTLDIRN